MNSTIETILAHKSVRKFKDEKLSGEQIETLVKSAQAASTSSMIQAYTIIGVTDPDKKAELAAIAGNQSYVEKNGHFFVFCADLYRHEVIGEKEGAEVTDSLESTEKFMVALIDAALAAQNASVAAESMGLGICYIGGIRNDLNAVSEVLQVPDRVIPLFGLAVGVPAEDNEVKPRRPSAHVYHENTYRSDKETVRRELEEYDRTVSEYYQERTSGRRTDTWSAQMARMLEGKKRMYMKEFIEKKKYDLK
ncbi:oxygen-insensitive NADPH nitroreductase [Bacillus salacetis]|uniref:Oxygen-insensitive NADPH nitroreductase n=1 Tax=Bacillus salacetis TaxID=2315464 RepID=A0A3A1QSM7_9BACI|nr:oxygen-insensitive NADPH nitroreductase [Bacillus salacetis]RIW29592.1 oxygen-insensitive NADPH nitroreductase [Bacillus salacetis]